MRKLRIPAMLLALCLVIGSLFGCTQSENTPAETTGKQETEKPTEKDTKTADTGKEDEGKADETEAAPTEDTGELELPLTEDKKTLKVWTIYTNEYVTDPNDLPGVQRMEEITNVHVDWIPVSAHECQDKLSLMIASGDYPDIIYAAQDGYPGGYLQGIEDGFFIDNMDEVVEKYMPTYRSILEADPDLMKDAKDDEGKYVILHNITASAYEVAPEPTIHGWGYRKDMLDAWGIEAPTTVEGWHEVLKTAKEKGCTRPCYMIFDTSTCFTYAFGISEITGFYSLDGKTVKFSPLEPGFKEYLDTMKEWYAEGLIDQDFASNARYNSVCIDAKKIEDDSCVLFTYVQNFAGDGFYSTGQVANDKVFVKGIRNPTMKEGDEPVFADPASTISNPVYITTACKDVELAAKWLDYNFTLEASLLNYMGIEGKTYEKGSDGRYLPCQALIDEAEKNGLTPNQQRSYYCRGNGLGRSCWGPSLYGNANSENVTESQNTWVDQKNIALPNSLTMTVDESDRYANLYAAVETLVLEYAGKYIIGGEVSSYEDFQSDLVKYGAEELLQIKQACFDRYNAR